MFVLMKSRMSSKLGHVGSKTRSLGQILEKPCVRSRGHFFSPILMKLGQNVCLDKITNEFELASCGVKNSVTWSNIRKPVCTLLWLRFLFSTLLKLLRMFALVISWMSLKIGHVGSKSRSLGQILEKPCVRCRGHIFSPILLKFSKNVCPKDILDQFENVLCWLKN